MREARPPPPLLGDARDRNEACGQSVAESDRARLVEKQCIDIACRLDRAPRRRQHVEANEAVHAGDTDRGEESADGRWDQRHQQGNENRHGKQCPGIAGKPPERGDGDEEDQRHPGQEYGKRQFIWRFLALGTFHQGDHAVEEA